MKAGDVVQIYTNPIECRFPEGRATLIQQLPSEITEFEKWTVKFEDSGLLYERYIKK